MSLPELYQHDQFVARRKVFQVFGATFHLYALDGQMLACSKQKAFRLKEDIRVFADENLEDELLQIKADRMIDFSASYSVIDSQSGEHYGTLRRKGWSSLFRDRWEILDADGIVRGGILEESGWKAFFRRFGGALVALLMPQRFLLQVEGETVATMQQHMGFFVHKFQVDLTHDESGLLPRPLAVAAVVLLLAIEGRQSASGGGIAGLLGG